MKTKLVVFIMSFALVYLFAYNIYQSYQINALSNCVYQLSQDANMYVTDSGYVGTNGSGIVGQSQDASNRSFLYSYWYKK